MGNQEVGKEVARRVEGAIKVNLLSAILIININILIINITTSIILSSSILVRGLQTLVHSCCFNFLQSADFEHPHCTVGPTVKDAWKKGLRSKFGGKREMLKRHETNIRNGPPDICQNAPKMPKKTNMIYGST